MFKAWAARSVDLGARLVTGQHGGIFGVAEYYFNEKHERSIADAYLTWGWSDPMDQRAVPVGQLFGRRPLGVRHSEQSTALLITAVGPRNSYHLLSQPHAGQWLGYLEDQFAFVEALPADLRSSLLIRLYRTDYGWDQVERWLDRCPDVELEEGHLPIRDLLLHTRVVLCSYNATTFLESFAMDIPTIMFWNPEHWELRQDAVPAFGLLEEAGLLFRRPADAARKLVEVWDDVDGWWTSTPVWSARKRFCELYNWTPDDLVTRVAGALRRVVSSPQRS
jgi:putative transferase (TIGR04331 family)